MSRSVDHAARAILNLSREAAGYEDRDPEYAVVRSVSPLSAELTEHRLLLDEEDLVVSQGVEQYVLDTGLAVGDALALLAMANGEWLVIDAVSATAQTSTNDKIDAKVASLSYSATVGDGSSTSYVVTHSLNSRNVIVAVWRDSTPWEQINCDVERTSVNTVTLRFATAPSSAAFRVLIAKALGAAGPSSTATNGTATAGTSSALVISAHGNRREFEIWNEHATNVVYLGLGAAAVVGTGPRIEPGGGSWGSTSFSGAVYAISTGASTGLTYVEI